MGTPAYMSPEQVRGEPLDARSDIFAFGSTLYEMATGRAPFRGESSADTLACILRGEPTSPRRLNPEVPHRLEAIIGKCLEKDPQDRYPRADEIATDLRALASVSRIGVAADRAPGKEMEAEGGETARRSRTRVATLAGILALLVVVGAAWLLSRSATTSAPMRSIAVLLFDNLGRDPINEAFTDGIHHDILTQLSKIRALKVVARTSVERLDPNLSIPEIGSTLGVATVLEGGCSGPAIGCASTCSSSTARPRPTSGPRPTTAS
jgi:serine/threonine-protein kinase